MFGGDLDDDFEDEEEEIDSGSELIIHGASFARGQYNSSNVRGQRKNIRKRKAGGKKK